MTSSNGINWTSRTSPEDNSWVQVIWVPELYIFVAVASSGSNRIMYSLNGIDWKVISLSVNNTWTSITWNPDHSVFLLVSSDGTGNRILKSTQFLITSSNSLLSNILKVNPSNGFLCVNSKTLPTTYQLECSDNYLWLTNPTSNSIQVDGNGSMIIQNNKSFNILNHNGSTSGLALNGTLVTSSASKLNSINGITLGVAIASKALVFNSSKSLNGINALSCTSITQPDVFSITTPGISTPELPIVLDENKKVTNINSLSTNTLTLKNNAITSSYNNILNNANYNSIIKNIEI